MPSMVTGGWGAEVKQKKSERAAVSSPLVEMLPVAPDEKDEVGWDAVMGVLASPEKPAEDEVGWDAVMGVLASPEKPDEGSVKTPENAVVSPPLPVEPPVVRLATPEKKEEGGEVLHGAGKRALVTKQEEEGGEVTPKATKRMKMGDGTAVEVTPHRPALRQKVATVTPKEPKTVQFELGKEPTESEENETADGTESDTVREYVEFCKRLQLHRHTMSSMLLFLSGYWEPSAECFNIIASLRRDIDAAAKQLATRFGPRKTTCEIDYRSVGDWLYDLSIKYNENNEPIQGAVTMVSACDMWFRCAESAEDWHEICVTLQRYMTKEHDKCSRSRFTRVFWCLKNFEIYCRIRKAHLGCDKLAEAMRSTKDGSFKLTTSPSEGNAGYDLTYVFLYLPTIQETELEYGLVCGSPLGKYPMLSVSLYEMVAWAYGVVGQTSKTAKKEE